MSDLNGLAAIVEAFGPVTAAIALLAWAILRQPSMPNGGAQGAARPSGPVSKEYESDMVSAIARIAVTLEAQTALMDKVERLLDRLIDRIDQRSK